MGNPIFELRDRKRAQMATLAASQTQPPPMPIDSLERSNGVEFMPAPESRSTQPALLPEMPTYQNDNSLLSEKWADVESAAAFAKLQADDAAPLRNKVSPESESREERLLPYISEGTPSDGDIKLPSGTLLKESDFEKQKASVKSFFREVVEPNIYKIEQTADKRAGNALGRNDGFPYQAAQNIKDSKTGGLSGIVKNISDTRREAGPARIAQDVIWAIDPEQANAYIAGHLGDNKAFAEASGKLAETLLVDGVNDEDINQVVTAMTPEQKKEYENIVSKETARIAALQKELQGASEVAWKEQAQKFQNDIMGLVVDHLAKKNMPKSELEAFAQIAYNSSIPGLLMEWSTGKAAGDSAMNSQIMQRAMEQYKPAIVTKIGAEAAGLLLGGSLFSAGGAIGKAGATGLRKLAEANIVKGLIKRGTISGAESVAKRIAERNLAVRIGSGAITSGSALGVYDAVSAPLSMSVSGQDVGIGDVAQAAAWGGATGAVLPMVGHIGGKAVNAATTSAGKYALKLGEFAAENAAFVGMGTLRSGLETGQWGSAKQLAEDFGHSVGVLTIMKSVGALKSGRNSNKGFYDKVLAETEFTPEEVSALGKAGVDGKSYKRAIYDLLTAKDTAAGAEVSTRASEFVSSRYSDIMASPDVPMSAKAKLMFLTQGRIPSQIPMTIEAKRSVGEDGQITVDLLDHKGRLVQRRAFSSLKQAEAFEKQSHGTRQINKILYNEHLINEQQHQESIKTAAQEFCAERGLSPDVVMNEVSKAVRGQNCDVEMVREVSERAKSIRERYDDVVGIIAEGIGLKYELGEQGLERAVSIKESDRSKKQSEAVVEYAERLREIAERGAPAGEQQPAKPTLGERSRPTHRQEIEQRLIEVEDGQIAEKQNSDSGVIYSATMRDGKVVNIIKGVEIVYNPETGEIDAEKSDLTVAVLYEDGTKRIVSAQDIDTIDHAIGVAEAQQVAHDAVRIELDKIEQRQAEQAPQKPAQQPAPESQPEQPKNSMIGRQLTDSEAQQVVEQMQAAAVPAPQMELTPENWDAEFGEDGIVSTPMGDVKMGENQYLKLLSRKREQYFGMVKPTLEKPDVVLEENDPQDGAERDTKYLFIKTFVKADGGRYVHFESVTVRKDNREVSISSHEIKPEALMQKMHNDNIMHLSESFFSSDGRLTEPQNEGPDLVPTPNDINSKDTITIPEQQETEQDIPRLKNGQPDLNTMTSAMLAQELSGTMDPDKAIERLIGARDSRSKEIEKLQKSLTGMTDFNKGAEIDTKIEATKKEIARLSEALELLGFVDKADQTQQEQAKPKGKNFAEDIERLFPEGLPNIHTRILSDIATGQRFIWADSEDGTKKGMATELGFKGNESERKGRFGILGGQNNGAKHVSSYVHDLWEDSKGYAFDMDDAQIRNEVVDILLSTPSRASAMEQLRNLARKQIEDPDSPRDADDYAAKKEYEDTQIALQKSENMGTFVDKSVGNGEQAESGRDNVDRRISDSSGVHRDSARTLQGGSDRGDIRVFEKAVGADASAYSDDNQRDRQAAEAERLIAIAIDNGLFVDPKSFNSFGVKYTKRTGESIVYIDRLNGKVYKVKDPYAKAAIKKGAPEDAIYEHLIHNRLFPETPYKFEGISEHLGDVRIVLSQDYVEAHDDPSQAQIDASLANRGLLRVDKYSFADHIVTVTDVEGDNALLGVDNQIYFIDPIIGLKKPARKVLDILDGVVEDVPFMRGGVAPEGVTPERWDVIIDQLKECVGGENVITDPAEVKRVYDHLTSRGEQIRKQQVMAANDRFNEQLEQLTPENANSTILDLGMPSSEMIAVGIADKPLCLYGNKLLSKAKKHNFDLTDVMGLPKAMETPVAIFKGRRQGAYAVLTQMKINDNPAIVIVEMSDDGVNDINMIVSTYGKGRDGLIRWIEQQKLLYTDKKRTLDVLGFSALIADALNDQKSSVTATNIVTNFENPKIDAIDLRKSIVSVNDRFNEQLEQLMPETANNTILDLGMPSPILQTAGMPNNPLRLYGNKLLKKAHRHGYDISDLRNLPQSIERPIAIFKGRYVGSFVLLTEIDINGKNAVATIDINKNSDVSLNLITSVYGKNADGIRSWIEESKLLYVGDKEKALEIASSSALNAGRSSNQGSVTATNIVTNFENPKIDAIDLRKSIVGAKSLLGVHNISEDGLLHAAKIGGLANPSMAIIDTANDGGFEKFGEITLVAPTSLIDKGSGDNVGVYGADIFSPRYPNTEREYGAKIEQFRKEVGRYIEDNFDPESEVANQYAKRNYLLSPNGGPAVDRTLKRESFMQAYYLNTVLGQNIPRNATNEQIEQMIPDQIKFFEWVNAVMAENAEREVILDGYTPSGRKKAIEHTLENVSRWMKKQGRAGGEGYNYGLASVRSRFAPKFVSIAQIQKAKGQLQSPEEFQQTKEAFEAEFAEIQKDLIESNNSPHLTARVENHLSAALLGKDIAKELAQFGYTPDQRLLQRINAFRESLKQMPTEYFEAKFERPVGLGEFVGAIVPNDISAEAKQALKGAGIKDVITYDPEEAGARERALRDLSKTMPSHEDIYFMQTPQGEIYGFTVDGKIYLDGSQMNANSPMHEYVELWSQIVARELPELWAKGVKLMKQTKIWKAVNADPNYRHLSEDKRVSETLARICGAKFEQKQREITDDHVLMGKLRKWLRDFWKGLKATFSKWTRKDLESLTADKFATMPIRDLVEGVDLRTHKGGANGEVRYARNFVEHKTTTLEKLEIKRTEIVENRENITNFEQQIADVDAQIEAYKSVDHVAATFGENGSSNAHLKAVEDVVHDLQRKERIEGIQITVLRDDFEAIQYLKGIEGVDSEKIKVYEAFAAAGKSISPACCIDDQIIIIAKEYRSKKTLIADTWHERAHEATWILHSKTELEAAAAEAGDSFLDAALASRGYLTVEDGYEIMAGEYISRAIEVFSKRGDLSVYLNSDLSSTLPFEGHLAERNVPQLLSKMIIDNLEYIKKQKYGYETEFSRGADGGSPIWAERTTRGEVYNRNSVKSSDRAQEPRDGVERRSGASARREPRSDGDTTGIRPDDGAPLQQSVAYDLNDDIYHVAATFGENGSSEDHLKAVEDVVYGMCQHFGSVSKSYTVPDAQKFILLLRELGATDAQLDDIDIDDCPAGVNWGDIIVVRADAMHSKSTTMVTYMHELAHLMTSKLFSFEQMYNAAEQMGADYMNKRLMQRHASYFADRNDQNSMVVAADETISRVVDIYQRRGLLDAFFSSPHTGTDVLIESLERDSVPNVLQELIIQNLQNIKDTKYGTETKEQGPSTEADSRLFFTRVGNTTPDGPGKRIDKSGDSIQNSSGASDQGDSPDRAGRDGGGGSDLAPSIFDIQEEDSEHKTTTLEKLEIKRTEIVENRENITNFEQQLVKIDAQIEAYNNEDHVAATFGENGSSNAHLKAVEDVVYDLQREMNFQTQAYVVRDANEFISQLRKVGVTDQQVNGIDTERCQMGTQWRDIVILRADAMKHQKDVVTTHLHEQTHYITAAKWMQSEEGLDRLYDAAVEVGAEYMNHRLAKNSDTYIVDANDNYSMVDGINEMISRDVEILWNRGLLQEYLRNGNIGLEEIDGFLTTHSVPNGLKQLVLEQCKELKYGKEKARLQGDERAFREPNNSDTSSRSSRVGNTTPDGPGKRIDKSGDSIQNSFGASDQGDSPDRAGRDGGGGSDLAPSIFDIQEEDSEHKRTKQQQLIVDLRTAMRDAKASTRDVATVVSRRVREEVGRDIIDVMGKREFDAIVQQIAQAQIRKDIERPLQRIAEIVFDLETKHYQKKIDQLLELKVQGESPRGVSVAKNVDDQTRQAFEFFRQNMDRSIDEVRGELEKSEDVDLLAGVDVLDVLDINDGVKNERREAWAIESEKEHIKTKNTALRKERIAANKAGDNARFEELKASIVANNELIDALNAELLAKKENLSLRTRFLAEQLAGLADMGKEVHNDWLEKREIRRKEIIRTAYRDIDRGDVPIREPERSAWNKRKKDLINFLTAPAFSMNYLLKKISVNAPKGEGGLYDQIMKGEDGYQTAQGNYWLGLKGFKETLNNKAKEIFNKEYIDILKQSNDLSGVTIEITKSGQREDCHLTIGEAVYVLMVDKMADGRVKLRRMGIQEDHVLSILGAIPSEYVIFADWLQSEFLPSRRQAYNQTHLKVFGTQMARVENYVPLKVDKNHLYNEVDGAADRTTLPSAITGSIIKRKRNSVILDLSTNAFDLMLEHGQQMEHWNAFTQVTQDMNAILSSTGIRRILNHRDPKLHGRLKICAQLACGVYNSEANEVNKAWITLGKTAASSKIAFRLNTAVKQILSYPAFISYSADPRFLGLLAKNLSPHTWGESWSWCMRNLPTFDERWSGRMAGDEKLAQKSAPEIDKWIAKMNKYGMVPNAFVDALTCANGAKAVYDFKRKAYIKHGRSEAEADRLAKMDAAIAINETQQSSEGMYISRVQADRDFWSVSISTFQNSNFAYLRKAMEGVDELFRDVQAERQNRASYYKERGFTANQAYDQAIRDVWMAKYQASGNIAMFVFIMNMLWSVGSGVWKYLFSDEDPTEDLGRSALVSIAKNTSVGSIVESLSTGFEPNPSVLLSDMFTFAERMERALGGNYTSWDQHAAYVTIQMLTANGLGVDLDTAVNMQQGVIGMIRDGCHVEDLMMLLNAPKSQAKLIAGKPKDGESVEDYHKRMIFIERCIEGRITKNQRSKWTRNYIAHQQAKLLGAKTSRSIQGNVFVPEIVEVNDAYKAALKAAGVSASGDSTKSLDWENLTEDQKQQWRVLSKMAWKIHSADSELNKNIIFNQAYKQQLKDILKLQREFIDTVNKKTK